MCEGWSSSETEPLSGTAGGKEVGTLTGASRAKSDVGATQRYADGRKSLHALGIFRCLPERLKIDGGEGGCCTGSVVRCCGDSGMQELEGCAFKEVLASSVYI